MKKQLPDPCAICGYPLEGSSCDHCEGKMAVVDGVGPNKVGTRFFVADLIDGFLSLFQASLLLMTKKEYMGKLTVAVLVNLVLVIVFFVGLLYGSYSMISAMEWSWAWDWIETAAQVLVWPLALIAAWFLAPTLINAGMTPFLDPIANATEMMLAGEKMKPVEIGMWRGLMAGLNAASQVLVLQVLVLIPVMLLAFIPVVGWGFVLLGVVYSAYLNALVWFEIPVLRRGYGWKYRRKLIRRNWARALGFGLAFNIGLLVPFFNFLFIGPATAVAVSKLYFRFDKNVMPRAPQADSPPAGDPQS
jgi:CysZ protein